ncbi:unnamed protein product, partial [Symbiodinium necroappetens]
PTCKEELCRQDDESVHLNNGCLVTFFRQVAMHAPDNDALMNVVYKSAGIRGVIALVDRDEIPQNSPQYVVFLDLRQIAESFQFLVLDRPYVTKEELAAIPLRKPPPGWRLRVRGGRMRSRKVEIQPNDTLTFGFEYDECIESPTFYSSSSEDGDEDEEDPSEGDEEEATDREDADSEATTRSRSQRRGGNNGDAEPSSDHSFDDSAMPGPTDSCGTLNATQSVAARLVGHAVSCADHLEHKWLTEPAPFSFDMRSRLDALRFLTVELGDPWPFLPFDGGDVPGMLRDFVDLGQAQVDVYRWTWVLVLKPGFIPEQLQLRLRFPSTLEEVVETVQAARVPGDLQAFPQLFGAAPQPAFGVCAFLAAPLWFEEGLVACMDLTDVDGRFFALRLPSYLDRQAALMMADLPPMSDVQVGTSFPHSETLPERLLSTIPWQTDNEQGFSQSGDCYCLALRYGFRLYFADPRRPMQYRDRLAEAVGCRTQELAIFPAEPRVRNAAVDGHHCRTVLVTVPRTFLEEVDASFCFLVDGRQLLQGWYCFRAPDTRVLAADVLDALNEEAPQGWCAEVSGISVGYLLLDVAPGKVLEARYIPAPVPVGGNAEDMAWEQDFVIADPGWYGRFQAGVESSTVEEVDRPMELSATQVVVFRPDYVPIHIDVWLRVPATTDELFAAVSEQCQDAAILGFVRLVEVVPQPDTSFVSVLLLPAWPMTERAVLIDGRLKDGRLFALMVPCHMNLRSLLAAADYDPNCNVLMYAGESPWALEHEESVPVHEGELFVVADPNHGVLITAFLSDMLVSPLAPGDMPPLGSEHEVVLVLSDREPVFLPFVRSDRGALRRQVAAALGIDDTDLFMCRTDPPLQDSCERGRRAKIVCVAYAFRDGSSQTDAFMLGVLDMRPILLGLQGLEIHEWHLDVNRLVERLSGWCPADLAICISGGSPGIALPAGFREVQDGEVLTVTFEDTRTEPSLDCVREECEGGSHHASMPPLVTISEHSPAFHHLDAGRSLMPIGATVGTCGNPGLPNTGMKEDSEAASSVPPRKQAKHDPFFEARHCLSLPELPAKTFSDLGTAYPRRFVSSSGSNKVLGADPLPHMRWGLVVSLLGTEQQMPGQFTGCAYGPLDQEVMSWEMQQNAPRLPPSALIAPFTCDLNTTPECQDGEVRTFPFVCTSYNALSLLTPDRQENGTQTGLYGAAGRVALLDASFEAH